MSKCLFQHEKVFCKCLNGLCFEHIDYTLRTEGGWTHPVKKISDEKSGGHPGPDLQLEPGPDSYFHLDWCPLPFFVSLEDSWRVSASSWPAVQPFEMLSYLKNIAKDTTDRELSVLAQTSCKQLEQDRSIIMCCQPRKGGVKILPSCQHQHQQQLTPVLSKHLQQPE